MTPTTEKKKEIIDYIEELRQRILKIPTRDGYGGFRHIEVYKEDILKELK